MDDLLLGEDGLLRVLPAAEYAGIPRPFLMLWAGEMGYHLFPTTELVEWLRQEIGGARAIEICAGAGVLGRALGVRCIDWDVCGRFPEALAHYRLFRQTPPVIGSHCEKIEALEAVAKYEPEVVFGGYVTQRLHAGDPSHTAASFAGVDERILIECVRKYIVIGSHATHGSKRIWKDRARELSPSWVVSRSPDPADTLIAVWENPNPRKISEIARPAVATTGPQAPAGTTRAPQLVGGSMRPERLLR